MPQILDMRFQIALTSTYACGRFWLSSVQPGGRLGDEKKEEERKKNPW